MQLRLLYAYIPYVYFHVSYVHLIGSKTFLHRKISHLSENKFSNFFFIT